MVELIWGVLHASFLIQVIACCFTKELSGLHNLTWIYLLFSFLNWISIYHFDWVSFIVWFYRIVDFFEQTLSSYFLSVDAAIWLHYRIPFWWRNEMHRGIEAIVAYWTIFDYWTLWNFIEEAGRSLYSLSICNFRFETVTFIIQTLVNWVFLLRLLNLHLLWIYKWFETKVRRLNVFFYLWNVLLLIWSWK